MIPCEGQRRTVRRFAVLALAVGGSFVFLGEARPAPADGTVLTEEPCDALPAHADLDEFGRWYFDFATWEGIRADAVVCQRIHYASGQEPVEGFLLRPREAAPGSRLPAIIYNRGGTGDFGRIDPLLLAEMRLLAREGFIVVASNSRFVGARARRDEWGGADLADVLNLVPLLCSRGDVDGRNLFMMGLSRGGFMTYLALRDGAPVNAAAVIAGPTDLTRTVVDRPEFLLGWDGYDGWAKVWPDFEKKSRELLEARSPVFWAERIRAPVLILHSRTDSKVPVEEALAMAQQLQEHGREYALVVYDGDGHSLPIHRADRNRRIVEWFRSHKVR
ncbi:MAG TPA: prolyl oligopeptidase family serine peptidase [Thermoanaerobaculia bacterium]|nr:prolyl oligopeptidase family serine peptidase [Thermoanaerobaculia bacterium]